MNKYGERTGFTDKEFRVLREQSRKLRQNKYGLTTDRHYKPLIDNESKFMLASTCLVIAFIACGVTLKVGYIKTGLFLFFLGGIMLGVIKGMMRE